MARGMKVAVRIDSIERYTYTACGVSAEGNTGLKVSNLTSLAKISAVNSLAAVDIVALDHIVVISRADNGRYYA